MKKTITYKEIKDKVLDIINNGGGGGGKSKLSELNDVTITSASDGQVLKYNGSKWVNGVGGGALNIKTLTYNGTGGTENTINFNESITAILCIRGLASDNHPVVLSSPLFAVDDNILYGSVTWWSADYEGVGGHVGNEGKFEDNKTKYHILRGEDDGACFNVTGSQYTVYYI